MANIKDLKKKIKSTKSTLKITQAMKLVSAAKLAKAQQAIVSARPYAEELEQTIKTAASLVNGYEHDFLKKVENHGHAALLVISSDKGLCGGYNTQLIKQVRAFLKESDKDFKVYFIGKKAKQVISKEINAGELFTFAKNEPTFLEVEEVASQLSELFKTGEIGSLHIAYNTFYSAMSFDPTIKQLLPLSLPENEKKKLREQFPLDFKYEPSATEILNTTIPEAYNSMIYTSVLNAHAAEHGSRMSAMESASKNCKEAIRELTIKMNKLRQAAITTELIEVVSGAESLNG